MIPTDTSGALVGRGDITAQATQVLENMAAVLAEAGGSLADVVKITTYVTDASFREPVQAVRRRFFGGPVQPASATVVVAMLVPDVLIEIEAVAVVHGAGEA
jgi:enamine deaminase RidA (YjgF/YER057c/UK114 family)